MQINRTEVGTQSVLFSFIQTILSALEFHQIC